MAEQKRTLAALQIAIQMEIDGKGYYLKASEKSGNDLGKQLLKSLAAEEDIHRQKFSGIYDAISSKRAWPATGFQPDGGKRLRTIFARAMERMSHGRKRLAAELEAVGTAMEMENKSYDFYESQGKRAAYAMEQEFYQTLAAEERAHHSILLDYYEYLKDPAGWFVKKEHPSLDGG